jgi:hypothetical protein
MTRSKPVTRALDRIDHQVGFKNIVYDPEYLINMLLLAWFTG